MSDFNSDESQYKGKWKRDFFKQVSNELKITQQSDKIPTTAETDKVGIHDFPRWEVLNVAFNKNKPSQSVTLYGNGALMPLQISLANAVYEMLSWQNQGDNFEGNALTRRGGNPQIVLFFEEEKPENIASKDFIPVQGKISWRLMEHLEYENNLGKTLLTWEIIEKIAKDIYKEFQLPNNRDGLTWKKGKLSYNYSDWNKGYGLKLHCQKESDGEELLKKILAINEHRFEEKRASLTTPKKANQTNPGNIRVLGEEQKKPRYRPNAIVRFKNATLLLSMRPTPIKLITRGELETFPQ